VNKQRSVRFCLTILFSLFFFTAFSQWILYPIPRKSTTSTYRSGKKIVKTLSKKRISYKDARVDSVLLPDGDSGIQDTSSIHYIYLPPRKLPFWEDFSSSTQKYYPDSNKWQYGKSVSWNFGVGINPPSLGVVSFDGLDSLQSPYDVTNNLDKGYGDELRSWAIGLDSIPLDQHDSTLLSFYFEYKGNGEPPDPGDHLLVEFRTDSNIWVSMAQIDVLDTLIIRRVLDFSDTLPLTDTTFYSVAIPFKDSAFFHNQFQFRISSFGRISGPWDTWIVDYVYLNTHRSKKNPTGKFTTIVNDHLNNDVNFPDRTIYSPATSVLGDYWSIPAAHFHEDSLAIFVPPKFGITNNRQDQPPPGQPLSFNTSVAIQEWKDGVQTSSKIVPLDANADADSGHPYIPDQHRMIPWQTLPDTPDFTTDSDSIYLFLQTSINSTDNLANGDYLPKFAPIDFRVNDTTSTTQRLTNFYAYDDGSAEFAAGLNQSGTEVAYRFDMTTNKPHFILGVDLYFPNVGDESSQTILLIIRKDTTDNGVLYSEYMTLQRSSDDKFIHHLLNRPSVRVQDHFYVGYRQLTSGVIALGLDSSHDTTDKIVFNVSGYWEQPVDLYGSLMIHPVFGEGVLVGLEEPVAMDIFPNPNAGSFYLSKQPDQVQVVDFTGNKVDFQQGASGEHVKIDLANPVTGIYLVKYWMGGKLVTRRVMVRR